MTSLNWITLSEFSTKYKISMSTLRRRIRTGQVENQFRNGKYWLRDQPVHKHINSYMHQDEATQVHLTPKENVTSTRSNSAGSVREVLKTGSMSLLKSTNFAPLKEEVETTQGVVTGLPKRDFVESENKTLQELKGAYVSVLQDKENLIMHLRAEISNLKTLVKILESENDRLSSNLKEASPIDGWIQENFE